MFGEMVVRVYQGCPTRSPRVYFMWHAIARMARPQKLKHLQIFIFNMNIIFKNVNFKIYQDFI